MATNVIDAGSDIELTILMPCLNEAETLGLCISKALRYLQDSGVSGEVVVGDNGSADGSKEIARKLGARVVEIPIRGYGAALRGGITAARGRFVIMGDADDSYDFSDLGLFLARLREGNDLVMGNRFKGGIMPGAMPFLHRYLGNPVLSTIGRIFFKVGPGDFHCGLRGFSRDAILGLGLRTTGMEFASEMVVRAALSGMRMAEVPTILSKDGRSRPPHLRTWRDGWRHLKFLLLYSPKWLFLYPGIALLVLGAAMNALLLFGPVSFRGIEFDIRTMLVASASCIVGVQSICFAALARNYAASRKLVPPSVRYQQLLEYFTLDYAAAVGALILLLGLAGMLAAITQWGETGFGALEHANLLRLVNLSVTGIAIGIQLVLTGFLSGLLAIEHTETKMILDSPDT
jgi:glycosyltransferase involved in cell wall biosynthesis